MLTQITSITEGQMITKMTSNCNWSLWGGQQLNDEFALDTETEMVEDAQIPTLAMVSVSDGEQTYIVHPNDLGKFLRPLARGEPFVRPNV